MSSQGPRRVVITQQYAGDYSAMWVHAEFEDDPRSGVAIYHADAELEIVLGLATCGFGEDALYLGIMKHLAYPVSAAIVLAALCHGMHSGRDLRAEKKAITASMPELFALIIQGDALLDTVEVVQAPNFTAP